MRDFITIAEGAPASNPKRKYSLYCTVHSYGPLVIAKLPEKERWDKIRGGIYAFMRNDFGVKAKEVFSVEGLAGHPEEDGSYEDPGFLQKLEDAFAGGTSSLLGFHLYTWDYDLGHFVLARKAVNA